MRARNALEALESIALFRAQAGRQAHRGHVEEIGDDLDSALSLLDLRGHDSNNDSGTINVLQGIDRTVLDWSMGLIAKLSSGLIRSLSASSASSDERGIKREKQSKDGVGSDQQQTERQRELHDRNARRWLSDPRTWKAFVRSLRGCVAVDSNTQLPQSAGVAILHAAVFAVRNATRSRRPTGETDNNEEKECAERKSAREWAFTAIHVLCGGGGQNGEGRESTQSRDSLLHDSNDATQLALSSMECENEGGQGRGGRAPLRMSLDVYVTFLEEVVRQHRHSVGGRNVSGGADDEPEVVGARGAPLEDVSAKLPEGILVQLLRFELVLQGNQSNRRKVFSTCCAKLMGPLFDTLPTSGSEMATGLTTDTSRKTRQLESASTSVLWDALFHEEHLEGYREAFTAAEAAGASCASSAPHNTVDNDATAAVMPHIAEKSGNGTKKRRRKGKKDGPNTSSVASGDGVGSAAPPRRACYQQQLLEEMAQLANGTGAGTEAEVKMMRVSAMRGAPLLLEGFILQMIAQTQHNNKDADIHQASFAAGSTTRVDGARSVAVGSKRSRSSGGGSGHAAGGGSRSTPASLMFRMWAVFARTLDPVVSVKRESSAEIESPSRAGSLVDGASNLLPFLRCSNAMLRLLIRHDVYRVNEDWGGREFKQLETFAAKLFDLADKQQNETSPSTTSKGDSSGGAAQNGAAQEFVKAFQALLGMNHNILHDHLRSLLRMTFEWAAKNGGPNPATNTCTTFAKVGVKRPSAGAIDSGSDEGFEPLRILAVALVVSLVDTYGRLRQMDHLVQALFGAICDSPAASALVLRGEECSAALGRAFQRLPEGQIESMWHVFAAHLRAAWLTSSAAGTAVVGMETAEAARIESAVDRLEDGAQRGRVLLAREIDGELFVLFVRNLHVTSSVAAGVGVLCARLADESLGVFSTALQQASTTITESRSPPSGKKTMKKKERRGSGRTREKPAGVVAHEAMLAFRPALDIHGWLLDLDTRCRFWSAILDTAGSAAPSVPESVPIAPVGDASGDALSTDHDSPAVSSAASWEDLSSIIAIAAETLKDRGCADSGINNPEDVKHASEEERRRRLMQTLQQVAIHRVQQIYARLNGVVDSEGLSARGQSDGHADREKGTKALDAVAAGSVDLTGATTIAKQEETRLETEARTLVAFACDGARDPESGGGFEKKGVDGRFEESTWGDEDKMAERGASWRMMMPYLPVWVGFAEREQVSRFLDALFTRCAKDVLAGRTEQESAPLRLLTAASFYEMEAVAQCAPAVMLHSVYRAIERAVMVRNSATGSELPASLCGTVDATSSLDAITRAIYALEASVAGSNHGNASGKLGSKTGMGNESRVCDEEEEGADDFWESTGIRTQRITKDHQRLLEACCLVMLAEKFPKGFLDEEAVAGVMLAADALDSVCVRSLSITRHEGPKPRRKNEAALAEALSSLRGLILRLGISVSPDLPLLRNFSPANGIVRVVGSAVGGRDGVGGGGGGGGGGGTSAGDRLLHASARLAPFLATRCLAKGQTSSLLDAGGILAEGLRGGIGVDDHNDTVGYISDPRALVLLHGLLSGIVAGETNRLSAAAAAAAAAGFDSDSDESSCDGSDENFKSSTDSLFSTVAASGILPALFALIARLMGLLPRPRQRHPATSSRQRSTSPDTRVLVPKAHLPESLLLVWGDALRLSFLGADAKSFVFQRLEGADHRARSQWVENAVLFLNSKAEIAFATAESCMNDAQQTPSILAENAEEKRRKGTKAHRREPNEGVTSEPGSVGPGRSERSACCHLLRAICGCCHLLDPLLSPATMSLLVEASVLLLVSGEIGANESNTVSPGDDDRKRPGETLLLQSAFCLLVQHAPEAQLHPIVEVLLQILEGKGRREKSMFVKSGTFDDAASANIDGEAYMHSRHAQPTDRGSLKRDETSIMMNKQHERLAPAAVTLLRLVTQAGRGGAFVEVVRENATRLIFATSDQIRLASTQRHADDDAVKDYSRRRRSRSQGLMNVAGALDGLEALLGRLPYASVSARVVAVVLGSLEPATSAAMAGVLSANHIKADNGLGHDFVRNSNDSTVLHGSLACFCACCRVLGALSQHYAKKLYSCAAPFAALCRSLLRLFFLAAGDPDGVSRRRQGGSNRIASSKKSRSTSLPVSHDSSALETSVLSADDQIAGASALSRVLQQFLPHKEVFKKYSAFLLLEYVSLAGSIALEPAPRTALLAGVFAVMEACSPREMQQLQGLLGGLPAGTGLEVFRSLYEEYQRQHKYTGKM